ncbi:MAG: hypothetical protein ACK6DC_01465, partial [Planctomycetota bacterium]
MFFNNSPHSFRRNRRTMLRQGLATAGGLALATSPFAQILAREAQAAGLKLGVQLYSLRGFPADQALKYA